MRSRRLQRLNTVGAFLALMVGVGVGCGNGNPSTGGTSSGSGGNSTTPIGGAGGATAGTGGAVVDAGSPGSGGSTPTGGSDGGGMADVPANDDAVTMPPPKDGGGAGSDAAVPTEGCGKPADQALARYVRKNTMVGNRQRDYSVYLPQGYDPMRPYRLVFLGHGCGGNGGVPFPFEQASKGDAIIVGLDAVGPCFDVNGDKSTELPYFDQSLQEVSSRYCVDKNRVFMAGFSAGSWLANLLGCARADVLRGQGNAEGQLPPLPATCKGPIAAMMAHDKNDTANDINSSMKARDRILAINKCSQTSVPYDYDGNPATPSPCVIYQDCTPGYPVVWCATSGQGHSPQVPITTVGLWRFWSQF